MRYHLFICRHAQAQNPAFYLTDMERDLTQLGKTEATQAGDWLRSSAYKLDLIVCSSARRTLSTASIIADKLAYNQEDIISLPELYNATQKQLLNCLGKISNINSAVLLVGHNPGVSELLATLSKTYRGSVPTGSVHHLWFEIENWSELEYNPAKGCESNNLSDNY